MMNTLQQAIKELEKARSIVTEVELLLKSAHGSNHKDFAHCANTGLGDSAATLVDTGTSTELAGERLSETVGVRQNEQAKECEWCDGKGWIYNEDHPKYPEKLQKIDCQHCS